MINYSRFATLGSITLPSGNRTTKNIWRNGPFTVSEKQIESEWDRRRSKFLSLQCPDLDVIKARHEVGSDLSRLLLGDRVGGILLPGLEAPVSRRPWPHRDSETAQQRTLESPA